MVIMREMFFGGIHNNNNNNKNVTYGQTMHMCSLVADKKRRYGQDLSH